MKTRLLLIPLLLLTLFLLSCELLLEKPPKPRIHALFISLDYYDSFVSPTNDGNRLYGTIRDVKEVETAMSDLAVRFDQEMIITRMFQEGMNPDTSDSLYPSKANILAKLTELTEQLTEHDLLFIYYTGHGMDYTGDLAVAHPTDTASFEILPKSEILGILNTVQQGRAIFIVDSCYSGVYVQDYPANGLIDSDDIQTYNPRVLTISASSSTQLSYELAILRSNPYSGFDHDLPFNDPENHFHGAFSSLFLESIGWDHEDGTGETIDGNMILVDVDGKLLPQQEIPTLRSGSITMSDIYTFIRQRIRLQRPMTVTGPLDLVLFSDRW